MQMDLCLVQQLVKKKGDFKNDFLIESYSEILRSKVHIKGYSL